MIEDYREAKLLLSEHHSFKSLIMCLMLQTIEGNLERLRNAFPSIARELRQYQHKESKERP